MGQETEIAWTDHTLNPWRGCSKVSAGCQNCYAETMSGRNPKVLGVWGPNGKRVVAAESYWAEPLKWERQAKAAKEKRRVFCASLADVFEDWQGRMTDTSGHDLWLNPYASVAYPVWEPDTGERDFAYNRRPVTLDDVRERLFRLAYQTHALVGGGLYWLFLTKRPENIMPMLRKAKHQSFPHQTWGEILGRPGQPPIPSWWFGTSIENQETADERIPHLLKVKAEVRFLSIEPLLAPIDFRPNLHNLHGGIHWAIIGAESGGGRRPCEVEWIADIARQCEDAGVRVFIKQDSASKSGQQGRIPADLWALKQFPVPHA